VAQETPPKGGSKVSDQLREPERVKAWVFRIARQRLPDEAARASSPLAGAILESCCRVSTGTEASGASNPGLVRAAGGCGAARRAPPNPRPGHLRAADIYRSVILLRDVEELTTEEATGSWMSARGRRRPAAPRRLAVRQKLEHEQRAVNS